MQGKIYLGAGPPRREIPRRTVARRLQPSPSLHDADATGEGSTLVEDGGQVSMHGRGAGRLSGKRAEASPVSGQMRMRASTPSRAVPGA